jgi:hypothetical protein
MKPQAKLVILVPDGAYPLVLGTFLTRRRPSLRIAEIPFEVCKDALHDSSTDVAALLRPFLKTCTHALVVRDLHGSGWEDRGPGELEAHLSSQLNRNGWSPDQSAALVVEPEIEAWLRFDSPHLRNLIRERARRRVADAELLFPEVAKEALARSGGVDSWGKPAQPKEAFEGLLLQFGIQRSNALYGRLAEVESLDRCRVPSFRRLVRTLRTWFPLS